MFTGTDFPKLSLSVLGQGLLRACRAVCLESRGHLFFWCNKLMGFVVIKSHLATLEKAFQKPLGGAPDKLPMMAASVF